MEWSGQQAAALKAVSKWLRDKRGQQVFYLLGYAGSGKTTLAQEIAVNVRGDVLFAAYTGKASLVLRSKGCEGASTIHSLIYRIEDEEAKEPTFKLNPDSPVALAELVIIDEELGRDLLSFGTKILVLGDPAQLPPIKGQGFFTTDTPDVMLTEIHRQAAENPIIRLSMDVRAGRRLELGRYGDSKIITRAELVRDEVLSADQVLVGMNKTRRTFNGRIRQLKGIAEPHDIYPKIGERLICLKNKRKKGLLNGGMWTVDEVGGNATIINMHVRSLDDPSIKDPVEVDVPIECFRGTEQEMDWKIRRQLEEFDHGYAITVHKSQGSQWPSVVLFDESSSFRENRMNHLYTAITRAADRVTIIL